MMRPYDPDRFSDAWDAMAILNDLPDYDRHNDETVCGCEPCVHIANAIDYLCHELGLDEEEWY